MTQREPMTATVMDWIVTALEVSSVGFVAYVSLWTLLAYYDFHRKPFQTLNDEEKKSNGRLISVLAAKSTVVVVIIYEILKRAWK